MANVPGLFPVQGAPTQSRKPLGGRVPTPDAADIRPKGLTPVASPVDIYSRPEAPDKTNDLMVLADALASINPSIQKFMQAVQQPADSAAKARQLIQTTDPAVLAQRMKNKDVPVEFQNLEGMRVYAEERAYLDAQELLRRYNEDFDKDNGDLDQLFRDTTQEAFAQYGDDRAFREVYTKSLQSGWERLRAAHNEYLSGRVMEERSSSVFGAWYGRIDNMTAEGKPPAEVVESLMGDIPKNRDFLKLHPKEQQKMLLQLASQQATKGNFDVAKTILSFERSDGPYKGSLMSDLDLGKKAQSLYAEIEQEQVKARMKAQSAEAEAQVYDMARRMVDDGSILAVTDATIPDEKGEPKTITADVILKETAKKVVEDVRSEAQYRNATPEQAHLWEKLKFVGSGLEHPVWFQSMNSAFTQASVNNVTQDKLPPTLMDAFTTYEDLYKDSPQYVSKYLNQKAMDFYETARVVKEAGLAETPEGALRIAQRVTQNPNANDNLTNQRYEELDAAVGRAISGSTSWWQFGTKAAANGAYVKDNIASTAKLFARAGLSNDEALKKAEETFERTHINVAGTYIKADKRMPPDFAPLTDQYLKEFADRYGEKYGFDLSDLTIAPTGNGTGGYAVVLRSTYMPPVPESNDTFLSFNILDQLRQRNRNQKITDVVGGAGGW